ncbi:PAS domain-containing sensor histidine kinase, partial [Xanthovirga aplysinae]|uniref:PAS domain-containing sensor histidine kinase n=1 Tax=Xanthovirga aplysinae TaxID=2529853 RepID=UPI0012BD38A1
MKNKGEKGGDLQDIMLDTFLELLPAPSFFIDEKFCYTKVNSGFAEFLGLSKNVMKGKSLEEIWGKVKGGHLYKASLEVRKAVFQTHEIEVENLDGENRTVRFIERALFDEKGEFLGVLGLLDDITDKTSGMDKLLALNKNKDTLLSIISHDLRGSLSNMRSLIKLQKDLMGNLMDEEALKVHNLLKETAKTSYNLLENLLMWAKSQANQIVFQPEKINLLDLVCKSFAISENNAKRKGVRLINNVSSDCELFADENMLFTVIRNLLSNAVKFSYAGGQVKVFAKSTSAGFWEVSIKDTGVGMNKELLQEVFSIEKKVSFPGTAQEKGSGLGLILCKEFVEKNGGKIHLK